MAKQRELYKSYYHFAWLDDVTYVTHVLLIREPICRPQCTLPSEFQPILSQRLYCTAQGHNTTNATSGIQGFKTKGSKTFCFSMSYVLIVPDGLTAFLLRCHYPSIHVVQAYHLHLTQWYVIYSPANFSQIHSIASFYSPTSSSSKSNTVSGMCLRFAIR